MLLLENAATTALQQRRDGTPCHIHPWYSPAEIQSTTVLFHFNYSSMPGQETSDKRQAAREVIDILHEIATLLVSYFFDASTSIISLTLPQNTHLNRQQLSYCVSLIENGVNPDALAVSNSWRRLSTDTNDFSECDQRATKSIPRTRD